MVVITDVCLCEYTDHGHCGILNVGGPTGPIRTCRKAMSSTDETLDVLAQVAVSHAEAGADIVAPSGMMDGMVTAIRAGLIGRVRSPAHPSYSTQIRLGLLPPFREAAQGAPKFGDRLSHQIGPGQYP